MSLCFSDFTLIFQCNVTLRTKLIARSNLFSHESVFLELLCIVSIFAKLQNSNSIKIMSSFVKWDFQNPLLFISIVWVLHSSKNKLFLFDYLFQIFWVTIGNIAKYLRVRTLNLGLSFDFSINKFLYIIISPELRYSFSTKKPRYKL